MTEYERRLDFYIDLYDWEKALYQSGQSWFKQGYLKRSQFLEICLWKSRRPKSRYKRNSEEQVIKATQKSFQERDERQKIKSLTKLKGVDIPTASAILSIVEPNRYPIIDIRCVTALRDLKLITWKTITASSWIKYLTVVKTLAQRHNKTPRQIEKGLFAYNRLKLDKDLKNLR
jgi:hypothetical protein